jgi:hypothetical protein
MNDEEFKAVRSVAGRNLARGGFVAFDDRAHPLPNEGQGEQIRQAARGEVCLDAGKAVRVSVSDMLNRWLRSPLVCEERDLPVPKLVKTVVLASQLPAI